MTARLTTIVFDAADPPRLGDFWSAVLGWQPRLVEGHDGWVALNDETGESPVELLFIPNADAKLGKNRVHLDINPAGADQKQELARLLQLGARHVDIGQGDESWFVLADPEGNEFCLLRRRVE
jgi:catechol 2,3-dioxygenase-like lactoylglutathione lyase family enzyme